MTESVSSLEKDHTRAITTLADKLKVPVHEVGEIYKEEFDRLAAGARIPTYLVVLAMSHTQSILRGGARNATLG
jgi:hypothetical protein